MTILIANDGKHFLSQTILIAAGQSAMEPRVLKVDGLDSFSDTQLY